jgi:hypothetical protein
MSYIPSAWLPVILSVRLSFIAERMHAASSPRREVQIPLFIRAMLRITPGQSGYNTTTPRQTSTCRLITAACLSVAQPTRCWIQPSHDLPWPILTNLETTIQPEHFLFNSRLFSARRQREKDSPDPAATSERNPGLCGCSILSLPSLTNATSNQEIPGQAAWQAACLVPRRLVSPRWAPPVSALGLTLQ